MRKIIVSVFLSMDGVLQAPGTTEEDTTGGFKFGGWTAHHWDDMMNDAMGNGIMGNEFELLLGRRTYELFAAHWPYQQDPLGNVLNRVHKYVVSNTEVDLLWKDTRLITGDVVPQLQQLKKTDGPDLLLFGSGRFLQTLFQHGLIDVLHAWTFPVTLGPGKKLFEEGTQPLEWKLAKGSISTTGVVLATYEPAGPVRTGSLGSGHVSEAEIARREKWKKEEQSLL